MKFENLQPGMTVYDVHSEKMGNASMRSMGCWSVLIESVDPSSQSCMARWNVCNPARRYYASSIKKWREKKPELVTEPSGRQRLKKRDEA